MKIGALRLIFSYACLSLVEKLNFQLAKLNAERKKQFFAIFLAHPA